jgi:hypothetical protein
MEYGAIDLHKKESQIRILTEDGEIVDRRIATTRERLTAVFWGRPRMRILLEAATESEWVAQHLETLGHEVIVADPNFTAMYGHRSRRIKTDRREGCRNSDPVHFVGPGIRQTRADASQLATQEALCSFRSATWCCVGFSNSLPCACGRTTSKSWKSSSSVTNLPFSAGNASGRC